MALLVMQAMQLVMKVKGVEFAGNTAINLSVLNQTYPIPGQQFWVVNLIGMVMLLPVLHTLFYGCICLMSPYFYLTSLIIRVSS
jgi:hypothetical protein